MSKYQGSNCHEHSVECESCIVRTQCEFDEKPFVRFGSAESYPPVRKETIDNKTMTLNCYYRTSRPGDPNHAALNVKVTDTHGRLLPRGIVLTL
ncbi:hypothetical protein Pmar_PMAR004233 [Perkinsus marinus ATCC 50983]|uniref:Uncharacterized protein n=1 Tax=Perkinsus marinus (strain ATCC 50983 / TXsc) TaxID=423536 RepID=C5LPN9_PERM5|nr:hypothetical protein Pmar_PMAR004233 [Perkinsus marinus ATCC 50983]EER01359.1 hypothetical protein Pmar_PMAR004233 [Perkinsus marinus ATCC 50983]|eukprot:XP_002768641.1 hypothetical protein Pmar_PMAR004233 [Perkinsus marinus ATCC 50983]